jgi:hypothetical protein
MGRKSLAYLEETIFFQEILAKEAFSQSLGEQLGIYTRE